MTATITINNGQSTRETQVLFIHRRTKGTNELLWETTSRWVWSNEWLWQLMRVMMEKTRHTADRQNTHRENVTNIRDFQNMYMVHSHRVITTIVTEWDMFSRLVINIIFTSTYRCELWELN